MPWHKLKKIEKTRICAMAYIGKLGFIPWHKSDAKDGTFSHLDPV
jgi:hypothetical protein